MFLLVRTNWSCEKIYVRRRELAERYILHKTITAVGNEAASHLRNCKKCRALVAREINSRRGAVRATKFVSEVLSYGKAAQLPKYRNYRAFSDENVVFVEDWGS